MIVLKAERLSKIYGAQESTVATTALDHFDLAVQQGEFVGVMGPSGSGKTTLLNILATIDQPTSGSVAVNGTNPNDLTETQLAEFRRRQLGFIFQDFNLLDTLSIKENIILPLALDNMDVERMQQRLLEVAEALSIDRLLDKRTYELSTGQQQRTAIARAIIHDPALILADEPTGNLDSKAAGDVMNAFERLNEEHGATLVMVTHDPFAASYCSRVVFIKDGKSFAEIRRGSNRQAFFQQILDSLSLLGGTFDELPSARS